MEDYISPLLLLPQHVKHTSSNLPLLKAIQKVLNESYTATYCAHPEIFGTSHVRLADPAQLADIIGHDGFTIVLLRVTAAKPGQNQRLCEVVATGSVKNFGDGDVEAYAQWSKNLSGSEWLEKEEGRGRTVGLAPQKKEKVQKYEVTAFGVSPNCQGAGLGARILKEIHRLVSTNRNGISVWDTIADGLQAPMVTGLELVDSDGTHQLEAIDLNKTEVLELNMKSALPKEGSQDMAKPKLVLMAIRELGNEEYYQRRGFKASWSGIVPVGMWDCKKECTMVYMEMNIE